MHSLRRLTAFAALSLLMVPLTLLAQDQGSAPAKDQAKDKDKESQTSHMDIDFGLRNSFGDVYGRPDLQTGQCLGCGLPFNPVLTTSKFGEYRDQRNGFFVRHADVKFDHVLNSNNYLTFKTERTLYRDQDYLASFGQYGKFKLQMRYDEIPHIYSDTARTLYTESAQGVWSYPALIRQTLQAATSAALPSLINTQVVPQSNFITPQILRRGGNIGLGYNLSSRWHVNASFFRESQRGTRPIGLVMNGSPSAATTSGFGMELPEDINYWTNLVQIGTEYATHNWGVQGGYIGSFFENGTPAMFWDNPFRFSNETITTPLTGRRASYPDNKANYLTFAGMYNFSKYFHFTASVTPGWLSQNQAFLPYTTNTAINTCGATANQACDTTAVLPQTSLQGQKQTIAMNFTLVSNIIKALELKANFRDYDYINNTPVLSLTPVQGDAAAPVANENTAWAFIRKNLELTGDYFFGKHSSVKFGYEAEWMNRTDRDVSHSLDNSLFGAVDWSPTKELLVRVSYRHSDRNPNVYQDDEASDPSTGADVACSNTSDVSFTADQRCNRRFDEAARLLNRGDALIQYSPFERLTVSAFGGILQNNYNRPGGSNSPTALNFLTGAAATTDPYYLYGVLKDISDTYGGDLDYSITPDVTFFAEYSHERYYKRMISRYRTPTTGVQTILTCAGCDSANNDWESVSREPVDIYSTGFDTYWGKKISLSTYYSLSATKGTVDSRALGDPSVLAGTNQFLLLGTNAAVNYPETVNRLHDIGVIFKYKVTEHFTPRVEYHYQQWDNKDYQTSEMTQYMGCVSAAPPAAPVPGCTTPILNSATSPNPVPGATSPFYPYFVVGDPSSARFLFLGVDQPSYHAHTLMATLEYRF